MARIGEETKCVLYLRYFSFTKNKSDRGEVPFDLSRFGWADFAPRTAPPPKPLPGEDAEKALNRLKKKRGGEWKHASKEAVKLCRER